MPLPPVEKMINIASRFFVTETFAFSSVTLFPGKSGTPNLCPSLLREGPHRTTDEETGKEAFPVSSSVVLSLCRAQTLSFSCISHTLNQKHTLDLTQNLLTPDPLFGSAFAEYYRRFCKQDHRPTREAGMKNI